MNVPESLRSVIDPGEWYSSGALCAAAGQKQPEDVLTSFEDLG